MSEFPHESNQPQGGQPYQPNPGQQPAQPQPNQPYGQPGSYGQQAPYGHGQSGAYGQGGFHPGADGYGQGSQFFQQASQQPNAQGGYDRLAVRQKLALTVNRYEVRALDQAGNEGQLLAFAEQKRMAFKEQVTFFTDEPRTQMVFGFKARQVLDLGATYDVVDGSGQPIGWFKKEFGKSFMRSTWTLGDMAGNTFTGTERSQLIAILRRLFDDAWWLNTWYHFDFHTADGQPVMFHTRAQTLRDCYAVDLPTFNNGVRLDWRLAAAMAVALDTIQSR